MAFPIMLFETWKSLASMQLIEQYTAYAYGFFNYILHMKHCHVGGQYNSSMCGISILCSLVQLLLVNEN